MPMDTMPEVYILGRLNGGGERETGRGGVCAHLMYEHPAFWVSHLRNKETKKARERGEGQKWRAISKGLGPNKLPFTANRFQC